MSTIYTFHRELAEATPVAGDRIPTADVSTDTGGGPTSKDMTLAAWGAAARGKATTDLLGFYGAAPIAQQSFTATCTTTLIPNPTFSATTGGGVWGFASSTEAAAYCKRVQQMQADLETLMGAINSTAFVSITGL
jgi:hypothetical protein